MFTLLLPPDSYVIKLCGVIICAPAVWLNERPHVTLVRSLGLRWQKDLWQDGETGCNSSLWGFFFFLFPSVIVSDSGVDWMRSTSLCCRQTVSCRHHTWLWHILPTGVTLRLLQLELPTKFLAHSTFMLKPYNVWQLTSLLSVLFSCFFTGVICGH